MVGLFGKVKSLAQQAQKGATEFVESEQFKSAVQQAQKAASDISESAQKTIQEGTASLKESIKETGEKIEYDKITNALNQVEQGNFPKAISTLQDVSIKSVHYEEAQQKVTEFVNQYKECILAATKESPNSHQINTAVATFRQLPSTLEVHEQAQSYAQEIEGILEKIIQSHRNLFPIQLQAQGIFGLNKRTGMVAGASANEIRYFISDLDRRNKIYNSHLKTSTFAGGEFCILVLNIENVGKKTRDIFVKDIILVDVQNRTFEFSENGQHEYFIAGNDSADLVKTQLQPGIGKRVSLVFDIPKNVDISHLIFPGGLTNTELPLSLALI